jgi:ABC-type transport system involved in multi-copper enzyme maturation permease subunit
MATGAHGVRFQYDYTHDAAGVAGGVAAGSRRWLRLVRSGDTLTAYDSADGHSWSRVGTVHLAGLPATVQMGLFVTSPTSSAGLPTLATGAFDRVSLQAPDTFGAWQGHSIGAGGGYATLPTIAPGSYAQTNGSFVVTGSGDIAPLLYNQVAANTVSDSLPFALIVGLLAAIVVATMFVTSEYRRGLIRTTFTAMPQRQLVLAGKVVVIGTVAFLAGAVAAAIAVPVGAHVARANGDFIFTVSTLAELRIILGSGVVVALGALGALGLATALRRSAGVITAGVVAFALPYMLALPSSLGSGATEWLYRVTPLAGFAVLQALPRYTQVSYSYTVANGYYPLAPWAGLGVLCAYAAVALAIAAFRLSRSDA